MAAALALPIGAFIGHTGRGALVAVNAANVGRAIPSYAVLVMVLPISLRLNPEYGLDIIPTFTAMTLLAIPPILVNTYTGLREVDPDLAEAARGMGMGGRRVLLRVETPIALPVILGGLRTAVVQVVATATLGAVVAYGGLGRYLIDGIARQEDDRLVAGVVLVAGLALVTEAGFAIAARLLASAAPSLRPDRRPPPRPPAQHPTPLRRLRRYRRRRSGSAHTASTNRSSWARSTPRSSRRPATRWSGTWSSASAR